MPAAGDNRRPRPPASGLPSRGAGDRAAAGADRAAAQRANRPAE